MRPMTRDQVDQFLRSAKEDPHRVVFAFALATGMRPQEYLGLRCANVDFLRAPYELNRCFVGTALEGTTSKSLRLLAHAEPSTYHPQSYVTWKDTSASYGHVLPVMHKGSPKD
jgi:integrase